MPDEGLEWYRVFTGTGKTFGAEHIEELLNHIDAQAAELATLRAKGEALDRLDSLIRDKWQANCYLQYDGLIRCQLRGKQEALPPHGSGPSLLEAINALPISSEEQS